MKKILTIIAVVAVLLVGSFWYTAEVILAKPVSADTTKVTFSIQEGTSSTDIGKGLKNAGLIRSLFAFEWYTWRTGKDDLLQSGEFQLSPSMSLPQVVEVIIKRKSTALEERTITIIEGWSNADIAAYFEKEGIAQADEALNLMQHKQAWWDTYSVLADRPRDVDLEGYLFPDTYRVYANATADEILEKLVSTLDKKLTSQMRADIKNQGKTIHEIMTMASIIEREVRKPAEMKMVSDIFWKRVTVGMGLQSDATINYITGKGTATPSLDDLKVESPYNTYKYKGLPPGPISNPGINAITAAIYPTSNPYFFYLTTLDTGEVIYAKDHDEHVVNKRKYLK